MAGDADRGALAANGVSGACVRDLTGGADALFAIGPESEDVEQALGRTLPPAMVDNSALR